MTRDNATRRDNFHYLNRGKPIMSRLFALAFTVAILVFPLRAADKKESPVPDALQFKMKSIDGKPVELAKKYDDKVLLVVNVASQCGLTPQYEQLQALHEKYAEKGLCVLGFPCNQFGSQEPGTPEQIVSFCKKNYGVDFDLFEKIEVNGAGACDLYKYLTALDAKPKGAGDVSWNFEKFLIGRDGKVKARFEPRVAPDDKAVTQLIESELAAK
jgi:glutathione peroxidase